MTSKSDPQTIGSKDNTTPAQDDIVKIAAMRNPVPKAEKPRFELPWPPRRENGATYLFADRSPVTAAGPTWKILVGLEVFNMYALYFNENLRSSVPPPI